MAPLNPRKDPAFVDPLLEKVRAAGASSVSVDVWWGLTEPQRSHFQWGAYDSLFRRILSKGLSITPILSFHACGANVGDNDSIPLPSWIWNLPSGKGKVDGYYDAQGRLNREHVAPWHQRAVLNVYREWMAAFRNHFDSIGMLKNFHEINVSLGPSGEIRYPAYFGSGCGYPSAGCYQFPTNKPSRDTSNDTFRIRYQEELFRSGRQLLQMADEIFQGNASRIPIGFKWPGLHWRWGHWSTTEIGNEPLPEVPYGVLFASGLLRDVGPKGIDSTDLERSLAAFWSGIPKRVRSRLIMHFTSLEQRNEIRTNFEFKDERGVVIRSVDSLSWAKPQELVRWMSWAAKANKIPLKGENALDGNLKNQENWDRIRNNLRSGYQGVTLLRLETFQDSIAIRGLTDLNSSLNAP